MKLLRTTALTAAMMTAAVVSLTSPAQAQAQAWGWGWGWPGLVGSGATAYGYGSGIGSGCTTTFDEMTGWNWLFCPGTGFVSGGPVTTPAYASGYGYGGPAHASGYGTGYGYPAYGAYRTAYHPVVRRHLYAIAPGVRRNWQ